MSDILYFRAGLAHVDKLVQGRITFQTEYWGPQPATLTEQLSNELRRYFEQALAAQTCIGWMAADGAQIVGIGVMAIREQPGHFKNPSGRSGYLMNMHTLPGYRRKGIASTILQKLEESARELGIQAFELHATTDGAPVYEKNGFQLHGEPTYRKYSI